MTFGEQIKYAREKKNLSQEELASKLGVSRQAVSKWENDSSMPHGMNRDMLLQILELEAFEPDPQTRPNINTSKIGFLIGGLIFLVLIIGLFITQIPEQKSVEPKPVSPFITSITFYDSDQNEVTDEALWYDADRIESILIQWEGGTPDNIKMFATPSGSETIEETELLLTKSVSDGDFLELLDADSLKYGFQNHVFFELDFGDGVIVTSEIYNIFYMGNLE